jgi:UDP-N-acetylglucosamine 2-epimerase (non-hydrolysing)
MLVFGTRPEAIKMAPVVRAVQESSVLRPQIVVTGQHREMLDQVLEVFDLQPDVDLDLLTPKQTLTDVTVRVLGRLEPVLQDMAPEAVVVQGDTTTTMATSLAAHYARIPLIHVEAGLRTNDRWSPYPEEINRRLTSHLTSLHLAPTPLARTNLLAENISPESVVVTGNTVIDALLWTVDRNPAYGQPELERIDRGDQPVLLVTAHRRESWGPAMQRIAEAVGELADRYPSLAIVVPMHRNPVVRDILVPRLGALPNVMLTEPMAYAPFARLMNRATVLLTDSGGVQEEGPSLGKPVLVMRDTTERPEAIEAGTAKLVGTDAQAIVTAVSELLDDQSAYDRMANAVNPYGDGRAASRCARAVSKFLGLSAHPVEEFAPQSSVELAG